MSPFVLLFLITSKFFSYNIWPILVGLESIYFVRAVEVHCIIYNIVYICLYLSLNFEGFFSFFHKYIVVLIWLLRIVKVHLSSIQIVSSIFWVFFLVLMGMQYHVSR